MSRDTDQLVVDLTRATPPATRDADDCLRSALRELSERHDLQSSLRSNRIGGNERDCMHAAAWLSARLGYSIPLDRVIVGNGAQNLLSLTLRNTSGCNGVLLAEALTHPLVPPIAKELGITVVPVEIDEGGVVPEAFESACRQYPGAPLYCNPTGHNPTTSLMPELRRQHIARIARAHNRYLIEDDVLGSLRQSGPGPIAGLAPDRVWYIQTLSKCIGLGIRVAYLVLPEKNRRDSIIEPVNMRSSWFPGALPLEVVGNLFETGRFLRLASSMADAIEKRRRHAVDFLHGYDLETCQGALHAWLKLPMGWSSLAFARACHQAGVLVRPSDVFRANASPRVVEDSAVRVALTAPATDEEFLTGLARLKAVMMRERSAELAIVHSVQSGGDRHAAH
jgi:DNA-binding transcriptional MocR family regulator